MARGYRRGCGRAQFGCWPAIGAFDPALIGRDGRFLHRRRTSHRRADGQVDAVHFRHLGLPAGEDAIGVMGLDPALEKSRRNRQADTFIVNALQVHPRKPARIDVLAHART